MSKGDQGAFYFGLIHRLLEQMGVPKEDRAVHKDQIHSLLKDYFNVSSFKDLSDKEKHLFSQKAEMLLKREWGLDADLDDELKF